jgi:hypothetical protein
MAAGLAAWHRIHYRPVHYRPAWSGTGAANFVQPAMSGS